MNRRLISRVDFSGDLAELLKVIAHTYELGTYRNHSMIDIGYEDVNIKLDTDRDSFFVKIFGSWRDDANCERYIQIIDTAVREGVQHPNLYECAEAKNCIYRPHDTELRLVVMQWLDGKTFYESSSLPDKSEVCELVRCAAHINSLALRPSFTYDSWAITNIFEEYDKWQNILLAEDREIVDPVVTAMEQVNVNELPHAFVHGDLITTNIMRTSRCIFILDFSVANYYPRIQELAVIFCDFLFDEGNEDHTSSLRDTALAEYKMHIDLTEDEIAILPLYVKAAHAMHIIGAARSEKNGEGCPLNDYFWKKGRAGLRNKA